jgi:pyruvate formate lyase activating enzyme
MSTVNEAKYYKKLDNEKVKCILCPNECIIGHGNTGKCLGRKNINGILIAENYGKVTSMSIDPIEKKPLHFYYPGSKILSVGTYGCNLECPYCQNHRISQDIADSLYISPLQMTERAIVESGTGNIGVAYTYNEPLIWYEYIIDTARIIKDVGLKNVLVTNGYINPEPLDEIIPLIDAVNIDLKAFSSSFYKNLCGGSLDIVKENIKKVSGRCHLELTTLIIPGENDNISELEDMLAWIKNISPEIPLHFTRYFPNYKYRKSPPASIEFMHKLKKTGEKYLKKIVLGNI